MADEAPAATNTAADGPAETKTCANCGSPMDASQDWCLQCGAGTSDSLLGSSMGWRSPVVLLVATGALVLGAAAASYAAWGKSSSAPAVLTTTVAQAPAPTATTPSVESGPTSPTIVKRTKAKLPKLVKPPKIPLTAVTPKTTTTTTTATTSSTAANEGASTVTTTTNETLPEPILLDTNAASTYNPNGYPASEFGDPTLAIDGDTSTGWSAEVNPARAPKLEAGVLIDLKAAQKIASVELISATPGMTVQLYGANPAPGEASAPASIGDPAWVKLSKTVVAKNRHEHIKFVRPLKAYRFIVLWIRDVPASATGTAEAPGHVFVNELELFPSTE